ncbi:Six-hairpin glycosidase superfamily [Sesbania bispinosa]|nr:Six-hairpin glycosidase superfamily [Sesbania bispinosa]
MAEEFSFHTHKLHLLHWLCLFYFSLTLLTVTGSPTTMSMDHVKPSTPLVSFLERLQETAFKTFGNSNFDPKTYVDLPLKFSLSVTEHAFQNLPKDTNGSVPVDDLKRFLEAYFEGAGDDLVYLEPEDFVPEPEGFLPKVKHPEIRAWALQDKASASKFLNVSEKQQFYLDLASAAESGWDFSTRWMRDPPHFTTLSTTSVIPVDLNAYLLGMELNIAFFAKVTGDNSTAEHFMEISDARKKAINSVFWNSNMKQWLDYWLGNSKSEEVHVWKTLQQNKNIFASNFVPLWMKPFHSDTSLVGSLVESLKTSGLLRAAGVATSLSNSGQQCGKRRGKVGERRQVKYFTQSAFVNDSYQTHNRDFPNGWAPLQHMLVEGLVKSGLEEARSLAEEIAIRWITTNYIVYKKTGVMHEKFDVEHCGEFGGGGEYVPQTGFGWSNGVVLAFLEEFGWPQDWNIKC